MPGLIVAALVAALCLGTLVPLLLMSGGTARLTSADWAALRFTLLQAALSSVLSVLLAIPVARALARQSFRGRGLVITLLGAPFILPVIVAVFGLLAIFGRSGVLNELLSLLGLPKVSIYGLHGVVLAHVFFNMPLVTRLLLQGWLAIPAERFRLAATLNIPVGRFLEGPMLRSTVPGALAVIFLICLTSFAVALTLGGGPRATTLELAIYQSLRFDFAPAHAALLALLQFTLCTALALMVWRLTPPDAFGAGLDRTVARWDAKPLTRLADATAIMLAALFLLLPLSAILLRGLPGLTQMPPEVWTAALRSLAVALASTALGVTLTLSLALRSGVLAGLAGALPLAASSLVLGTGLFLLLYPFADPVTLALPVTALVNAVMSLPFALRILQPAIDRIEATQGRTATSLGLTGMVRLRIVILPRLRRPLGFAAGLTAALSMGDLGVIALFAPHELATLPLMMQQLMGSYRMDAAAGVALLLVTLSLALFWLFDQGSRADADA
jgi:thiamine transport system permease protein